jgi:hypothetical protein
MHYESLASSQKATLRDKGKFDEGTLAAPETLSLQTSQTSL